MDRPRTPLRRAPAWWVHPGAAAALGADKHTRDKPGSRSTLRAADGSYGCEIGVPWESGEEPPYWYMLVHWFTTWMVPYCDTGP